jgi:hypothetical protein
MPLCAYLCLFFSHKQVVIWVQIRVLLVATTDIEDRAQIFWDYKPDVPNFPLFMHLMDSDWPVDDLDSNSHPGPIYVRGGDDDEDGSDSSEWGASSGYILQT